MTDVKKLGYLTDTIRDTEDFLAGAAGHCNTLLGSIDYLADHWDNPVAIKDEMEALEGEGIHSTEPMVEEHYRDLKALVSDRLAELEDNQ